MVFMPFGAQTTQDCTVSWYYKTKKQKNRQCKVKNIYYFLYITEIMTHLNKSHM